MVTFATPLRSVIGDKTSTVLEKAFGMQTAGDLLRHYPRRYFERGELADLARLVPGERVTLQASVASIRGRRIRPKLYKTDLIVTDGTVKVPVTFFNRPYLERQVHVGMTVVLAGDVDRFRNTIQLTQPELNLDEEPDDVAGSLMPIYAATKNLQSWQIRKAVRTALDVVDVDEPLPAGLRARHDLLGLGAALQSIHRPRGWGDVTRARQRLKWDEAFALQVLLAQRRAAASAQPAEPRTHVGGRLLDAFDEQLPFELTVGQVDVTAEIFADLAEPHPMHRLLQGEVGSGKTVVALRAMLLVVDNGGQAALLAPTEVLAQQHARTIRALLGPLAQAGELGSADVATRVALLTGSQSAPARRENLLDAAGGAAGIVVGTHALLQEHVQFADLGLVVVDEQHRFGVEQRDALRAKADTPPHVLVMTATPIPRTVAMTVYGDLETSMLTELPGGRQPIQTTVVPVGEKPQWVDRVWERVREEVGNGRQAYVVCPRIDGDNADEVEEPRSDPDDGDGGTRRPAAAVGDVAPMLADGPLSGLHVDVLHGRLSPEAKDDVMRRFTTGAVDVLVATTVIEVGVDVANATVMVVLDADRFGVSQLHQLRGRVGRGAHAGLCLLVTTAGPGTPSRERLDGVAATLDGVALARLDLEQRREGDVLGAVQSGRRSSLRLLQLLQDEELIGTARAEAAALVAADADLAAHPVLRDAVRELVDTERADYLGKA